LRFPARFHHPVAEKKAMFLNVVQNAILQFLYGVPAERNRRELYRMGLIKAIAGAAGGVMADQWKEYSCPARR